METVEIPIFAPTYRGVSSVELVDRNRVAKNVYFDVGGVLKKRPAFRNWMSNSTTATATDDLLIVGHWPNKSQLVVATSYDGSGDHETGTPWASIITIDYVSGIDGIEPGLETRTNDTNSINTADFVAVKSTTYTGTLGISDTGGLGDVRLTALNLANPISYAYNDSLFLMASGGRIVTLNGDYEVAEITDADAPTAVTHLGFIDTYILAFEKGNDTFYWSDVSDPTSWNGLSLATAGGSADLIQAGIVFEREVFIFGQNSIEIWEDDGVSPFSRVPGGLRETGCSAPYAITTNTDYIFFFNQYRKLCAMNGRKIEQLDTGYDQEFQAYTKADWESTRAYRTFIEGQEYLLIMFSDKWLLYHIRSEQITEIQNYAEQKGDSITSQGGGFLPPIQKTYGYFPEYNKHVFGMSRTQPYYRQSIAYDLSLFEWDIDAYEDRILDFASSTGNYNTFTMPIRVLLQTGHLNFGTGKVKRSHEMRFTVKRGTSGLSTTPKIQVRWRDDGETQWKNWHELSLGNAGEGEVTVRLHRTGAFRTRQYEFVTDANVPLVFVRAEEDIEVLR